MVFCRTWYKVDVTKFYNPVATMLLPFDKKHSWKGVRTTGQLKREKGVHNPANLDSIYTVSTYALNIIISSEERFITVHAFTADTQGRKAIEAFNHTQEIASSVAVQRQAQSRRQAFREKEGS